MREWHRDSLPVIRRAHRLKPPVHPVFGGLVLATDLHPHSVHAVGTYREDESRMPAQIPRRPVRKRSKHTGMIRGRFAETKLEACGATSVRSAVRIQHGLTDHR